ncbi:methylation-associated defense system restriction endonuclease subunit S MAD5 [Streptomyces atroolivaceus]|uniref:methylation-associated defense system restriction endonuclease subunit S MAD5 n=1 Tax=Streptomyces atroolivaceus TaxID=66869 RepID=UPI00364453B5
MKLVNPSNPVTSAWLAEQGFRLDPAPYLSGAQEAKKLLERLPRTDKLSEVTTGIFHAGRFSRRWVQDREHGIPFFSSTDILEADFSYLPLVSRKSAVENPRLLIKPGWTLITRSGTVGRIAYARSDADGFACSEHVMRAVPNAARIPSGFLYTFLRSPYGVPMIASSAYGAIIQHIEPDHIAGLPVPRFGEKLEQKIHDLVEDSSRLRTAFQEGVVAATEDFFKSVGLSELNDLRWHQQERDLGFSVMGLGSMSLRAMNYARRASVITAALRSVESQPLGDICEGGLLSTGPMFKRIDSDYEHGGTLLVGQRQGWWNRPEDGRVLSRAHTPKQCFVPDETVMVGAQGLPSENGLLGRAMMVTGRWLPHAYSQHFLRISSGPGGVSGAFLFSFLRSEAALRVFRTMMAGSGPQSLHRGMLRNFPIPLATAPDRERIAETVRQAYRDRDQADVLEDQALALLTEAIEKEAAV